MASSNAEHGLTFAAYSSEQYLQGIIDLISLDLSSHTQFSHTATLSTTGHNSASSLWTTRA